MVDLMLVMVVLGAVMEVLVVQRAELKDVRQRREKEQHELQQQFLGGADAHDKRQYPK